MCGTTYYTHEDVQNVSAELRNEAKIDENAAFLKNTETLIAEELPYLGTAILANSKNPVQTVSQALAIGVAFGLKLAGAEDYVNPKQELSIKVQEVLARIEAHQYEGVAATAAAA